MYNRKDMRRLINEGVSMYKIAELYGVSRMTVSRSRNV